MKRNSPISLRLPDDLLAFVDARVTDGDRSAYIRDAIRTHAALLDLVAALGCRPEAKQ